MNELPKLDNRISKVEERNKKVEKDKSWETNLTHRVLLIIFTYLSMAQRNRTGRRLSPINPDIAFLQKFMG